MASLQETMDAARQAASNLPATQDATTGTAVAPQSNQTFSTDLDDFLSGGGIRPDKWIQVKDGGIRLDKDNKAFVTEFTGNLNLSDVLLFWGSRAEFAGGKLEYAKSYDGQTTVKGESFSAVLAQFKANSTKDASPYRGADLVVELTEDVKQGTATIPAGTKVGWSTSITGFAPFQSFMQSMKKAGKLRSIGDGDVVKVKVTHEVKTNGNNQDYGILNFELVD